MSPIVVHQLPQTLGEFKQALMKEYNQVNQLIFKVGVIEQQVSVVENKILIIAKHKRIPVLEIIESSSDNLSVIIDRLLIEKYKNLLEMYLVERFGFRIQVILKDYHPEKEISGTIIILDQKVEEYLTGKMSSIMRAGQPSGM